jgi:hypothetical protein
MATQHQTADPDAGRYRHHRSASFLARTLRGLAAKLAARPSADDFNVFLRKKSADTKAEVA